MERPLTNSTEKSITLAKGLVNEARFNEAAALGEKIIEIAPQRREGYRILVDALAKGNLDLTKALGVVDKAYSLGLIDTKMQQVHVAQILKSAVISGKLDVALRAGKLSSDNKWTEKFWKNFAPTEPGATTQQPEAIFSQITKAYPPLALSEQETLKAIIQTYAVLQKPVSKEVEPAVSNKPKSSAQAQTADTKKFLKISQDCEANQDFDGAAKAMLSYLNGNREDFPKWHKAGILVAQTSDPTSFDLTKQFVKLALTVKTSLALRGLFFAGYSQKRSYNSLVKSAERMIAVDCLLAAVDQEWKSIEPARIAFTTLLGIRDFAACDRLLEKWKKQRPGDQQLLIACSRLAEARHKFEDSIDFALAAIEAHPNNAGGHRRAAHAYRAVSKTGKAIEHLRKAQVLAPKDLNIGRECQQLFDEASAVRSFSPRTVVPKQTDYFRLDASTSELRTHLKRLDIRSLLGLRPKTLKWERFVTHKSKENSADSNWILLTNSKDDSALVSELFERDWISPDASYYYGSANPEGHTVEAASWILISASSLKSLLQSEVQGSDIKIRDFLKRFRGRFLPVCGETPFDNSTISIKESQTKLDAPIYTLNAAGLVQDSVEVVDFSTLRSVDVSRPIVATPDDWEVLRPLAHHELTLIILIPPHYTQAWENLSSSEVSHNTQWVEFANSIVVTTLADEERLEDHLKVATQVFDSFEIGISQGLKVASNRICVAVGAGIGNILFTTPLLRSISETYGCPIDVVINSPVGSAVQIFGESEYINLAFTVEQKRAVEYSRSFITSCFGNKIFGYRTIQRASQRNKFDFYSETRELNEAKYAFLGADNLFPEIVEPDSLAGRMFIRNFSSFSRKTMSSNVTIGLSGPQKTDIWSRRQWPFFPELVKTLKSDGFDLRSFGLPGEEIPDTKNYTNAILRHSIRQIAECDVFITSDGGIFHIADALGVETIAIFGPTSAIKNGSVNGRTVVLQEDMPCSPCQFNQSFMDCGYAACMAQITPKKVKETCLKIIDGELPADSYWLPANAKNLPDENHRFSAINQSRTLGLASLTYNDANRLFNACYKFERFERAAMYIDQCFKLGNGHERDWLASAKLAIRCGDYPKGIQITSSQLTIESNKRTAEWLRLQFEALVKSGLGSAVIQTWRTSPLSEQQLSEYPDQGARVLWMIARAHLEQKSWSEARTILEQAVTLDPKLTSAQKALNHFRPAPYSDLEERAKIEKPAQKRMLVVTEGALPPSLKRVQGKFSIYKRLSTDLIDIDRFDIVLKSKNGIDSPDIADDTIPKLKTNVGAETHVSTNGSYVKSLLEHGEIENPAPRSSAVRILVVAHHHLQKWNPRGGERSTHHIIKRLQQEGYEVLVVVENKKSDDVCCEHFEGIDYVISGRYALQETLSEVIELWQPDAGMMYGETSLRAYESFVDSQVPYLFMPRDWQEICSRPYTNLLNKKFDPDADQKFANLISNAGEVITNAKYVGQVISHLYDREPDVSYVPVELPQSEPGYDPSGPILLVNPKKMNGGALIMDVARLLPHRRFRVVGSFDKQFPENVEVEPFFNGNYEDLYAGSSLFLFPLIGEDPCGTGRVVFEALHCGVPSISMQIGGMKEVLPNDWLIPEDTPEMWAQKIEEVLNAPTASERCAKLVEDFEPEAQTEVITSTLARLVSQNR